MQAKLLVDGKNAFPAIINEIGGAKQSIYINMFIWRDDNIGNRMAEAVLSAADRGVKVTISSDRFGVVLEKAEECRKSFFHKKQTVGERLRAYALARFYKSAPKQKDEESALYRALLAHPNITVEKDRVKKDHSKFYVIDNRVLFLGGINVEDKENGADMQGRVYRDYMARLEGEEAVSSFWKKLQEGKDEGGDLRFFVNTKPPYAKNFEIERAYLDMLARAKERILLVTAYFSPMPKLIKAIQAAHDRGVKVDVLIPARANLQQDCNFRTARKLLKKCPDARVFLSPYMVHAKALIVDGEFCFGSANFNRCAFRTLSELNLWGSRGAGELFIEVEQSILQTFESATRVTHKEQLKYRAGRAAIETLFG